MTGLYDGGMYVSTIHVDISVTHLKTEAKNGFGLHRSTVSKEHFLQAWKASYHFSFWN